MDGSKSKAPPPASTGPDRRASGRRLRLKLSQKISLLVVAAALLTGAIVAVADYRQAARELSLSAETKLTALLDARRVAIVDYLASIRRDLRMQATNPFIIQAFEALNDGWMELGARAPALLHGLYIRDNPYPAAGRKQLDRPGDLSIYSHAHSRFHPRLRDFVEQYGYRDLLLVDLKGAVIYSVMKQEDFASNLNDPVNAGGLVYAYRRVGPTEPVGAETFVDFSFYPPAGGRPTGFVARPLFGGDGAQLGVIVIEMPVDRISRVINVNAGLGETGETFIAGRDLLMRSDSRFSAESTILTRRVDSGPVKAALEGRSGIMTGAGGGEDSVLSAYAPLDFLGARWAIVAQANLSEVYAPVYRMRNTAILNGLLVALSVAALGYLLIRATVVGPLTGVAAAVQRLNAGDRGARIPSVDRGDEIGDIARALVLFRDNLVTEVSDTAEQEREAKAEEVRRRLAEAIEAISDGFILLDPDRRVVLVNSKYRELYERSAHLLTPGADFGAFMRHHAELGEIVEARGRVEDFLTDRLDRMKPGDTIESRLASGRWLLISDFQTEDGGTVTVCSDITDLKRREHALADSEDRYRLLVDTLPDGVLLHDIEAIQFLNAAGREILDIPEDSPVENFHYRDFVHDTEREAAEERIRTIIDLEEETMLAERRVRTHRGREIVIEISAVPFRRGAARLWLAVFRDITDRKRTEMRLRESEGQVRAIVEAAADAIVMLDGADAMVDFNPAAERIFGCGRDSVLGKPMAETLIAPGHRAIHKRGLRGAVRGGKKAADGRRREIEGLRADGSLFPAELTIARVTVEGRLLFAVFLRDLTETHRAQTEIERQREALHQSEKLTALGSLLAGVAHELNNPLSVVVAQAVLMEETVSDEKIVKRAREIRSAAERCARIVKTFLSMARQQTPERGAVNLNELIENGLELFGYTLRTADIEVVRNLDPALPEVWGDADQLHQVVANLIVNAQQSMMDASGEGRLTVSTEFDSQSGMSKLCFDDTGPGIPADLRLRIFDPFFTTKPTGIGTGIGLAVCDGVIESHGGSIVAGESPGGGARFVVLLPPGAIIVAPAEPALTGLPPKTAGRHILVVDDEPEIAVALAEVLSRDGHDVDVAENGLAALDRIAGTDYDLILMDLRMPGLDGPGLYRKLEEDYPHLCSRVVVVTGDTLYAAASEFLQQANLPMIEKPFDPADVSRIVAEALAKQEPGQSSESGRNI